MCEAVWSSAMNYIMWLTFAVWLPTAVLWAWKHRLLWRYKKTFLHLILLTFIISIPWDFFAVGNRIWFFPKEGTLGVIVGGLPLEEYLFMITVAFFAGTIVLLSKYQTIRR